LRPRDFIVVCAIVLIAGFAAADAIRGRVETSESVEPPATPVDTSPTRPPGPEPQAEAPPGWPVGTLQGSLVFTNADDCRVRVLGLAGGTERPLSRFTSTCQLWAPPVSERIAYGLGLPTADGFTAFKIADLSRPQADLGGYRALFGVVLWSPDGQRIAWCGRRRTGFDLEVGGAARRLPRCPAAYTADSRIAYAVGNRLLVEDKELLRTDGGITFVHFGSDGSVAVVVDGERLERYDVAGKLTASAPVPQGRTPILSPRNCAALFRPLEPPGKIRLVELGCYHGRALRNMFGTDATWAPDGSWVALSGVNGIEFRPVASFSPALAWPARAVHLAWRVR
jgi:WD40-like Beta Propeller Repeat